MMGQARLVLVMMAGCFGLIAASPWFALTPLAPPIAPPVGVSGVVFDEVGPCSGARARWAGGGNGDWTDHEGRFFLPSTHPVKGNRIVTAWKPGYFIASSQADADPLTLLLRPLPRDDHADYRWIDPTPDTEAFSCGNCHPGIYTEWNESAHGPHRRTFQRIFHDLERDQPERSAVCLSCHDPAPLQPSTDLLTRSPTSGVHCDFCHKVFDADSEQIGLTHGRFGLDLRRPTQGQVIFGPWIDSPRAENSYSPIQRSSRLCASCHEGVVFGLRVYETWTEWQTSPAALEGIQCQDCHMKPTGQMDNVAPHHGGLHRDPGTVAQHRFFAGGHREMLRQALRLSLRLQDNSLFVEVEARHVGHFLPTGFPDRHLTLVVKWYDSAKRLRAEQHQIMAKRLADAQGRSPVSFWLATTIEADTRLKPHQPQTWRFDVPPGETAEVAAELIYRRTWPQLTSGRPINDEAWIVHRAVLPVRVARR